MTEGWTYDANENRLSETGTSPSTYSVSATNNQITGITGITGTLTRSYAYDAAGDTSLPALGRCAGGYRSDRIRPWAIYGFLLFWRY